MTLARSLRALQLVADLPYAFISQLEDSLLCGATVIAVKTSIDRAIFRTEVSHVVQARHRRSRAVMDTTVL